MMLIGTLALTGVGIPHLGGFAGFHSKDAIIEAAYAAHNPAARIAFWLLVVAAFMTSFYSWRLMFMTFYGEPKRVGGKHGHDDHGHDAHAPPAPSILTAGAQGHDDHHHEPHESPWVMLVPLIVLAIGAVLAGIVFQRYFIGTIPGKVAAGSVDPYKIFWGKAIFEGKDNHILHDMHKIPGWVGWAPFGAMASGFALSWLYYIKAPSLPAATARAFEPVYKFLLNKWYFDELYDFLFVRPALWIGGKLWKVGDGKIIDGFGPDGISARVQDATKGIVKLQTGYVYHYAFAMMIGVAAFVTWFSFGGTMSSLGGLFGKGGL
jgi:NADH-quinone oxidoreductase subunit L